MIELMRARRFWPLFWVMFLGAFNDQVFKNAFVALLTFRLADQLGLDADLHNLAAAGLFILPFALFSPTAGQLADRLDKARIMRWVKAVEIGLMAFAAICYHLQSIELLYVLVFLMGAQSAFFGPVKYAVLAQYLPRGELMAGNGLVQGGTFIAILLGQIAGAKLILTPGGVTLVSIAVVVIAIIGYAAARHAQPAPPQPGVDHPVYWNPIRAIWRVLAATMGDRRVLRVTLAISWFWFAGAAYLALVLPFAKEALGASEDVAVILLTMFSVGVALGAFLCNRLFLGVVKVGLAPLGALGIAVFSVALYLAVAAYDAPADGAALLGAGEFLPRDGAWAVLTAFVALAVSAGIYVTPLNAVLQTTAEDHTRGRVIAGQNVIVSLAMVLSSILASAMIASGLDRQEVLLLIGGSGAPAALYAARMAPETILGKLALTLWPMPDQASERR